MVVVPYVKGYLSDRDEKAFLSLANDLEQDYPGHNIIFLGLVGSHAAREPDENSDRCLCDNRGIRNLEAQKNYS